MRPVKIAIALFLVASMLHAAEGKWTPQQLLELDPALLEGEGLQLPVESLWNPQRGTGLLSAAVSIGGCSAGFVSSTGLLITNHHCIFSILQQHSSPGKDLITDGFLANGRSEELPGQSIRVTIPRRFTDVTADVLRSVSGRNSDLERFRAIEKKKVELVERCERHPASRCKIATFDGGLQYVLVDAVEFQDVRLVYAPPRSVGEYGGEVDNWMWPRHTGDFSLARVYASKDGSPAPYSTDNVPYYPEFHFPLAKGDLSPGDFVMVLGYPGLTWRSYIAAEMAQKRNLYFPGREGLYGEWIAILQTATENDAAGSIAVADTLKSLLNRYKNAQGQIAGFDRGEIVKKQLAEDEAVLQWIQRNPRYRPAADAYEGLRALETEQEKTWNRDFLLEQLPTGESLDRSFSGPKLLSAATLIARVALARQKKNDERSPAFMDRNLPRLRERISREEKSYFAPADEKIMESWVRRMLALPRDQRPVAIEKWFGGSEDGDLAARIHALYEESRLDEPAERTRMFDQSPATLHARKDPLLEIGFSLADDIRRLEESKHRWEGAVSRLRPEWRRAVIAHAGKPVAPDANGTLRVSLAHVKGYSPRDAVIYEPQTTVAGMVSKNRGEEPFEVPEPLLDAVRKGRVGRWEDPQLGDVPVDFLATADTTGGNSGSPVINGKGELVGVNFDRVWENVANDFGYNPDVARNISVDVRYLLWMLDQISHADGLLEELGVKREP